MTLKLSLNKEQYPKGMEFDVGGVLVENGGSTELDEDAERRFISRNGMDVKEFFAGSEEIKVEGTTAVKGGAASMLPPPEEISDSLDLPAVMEHEGTEPENENEGGDR